MNDYQQEQLEALELIRAMLPAVKTPLMETHAACLSHYLEFRQETDRFLTNHFSEICSRSCYRSNLSACCSKDGIITFFADMVINVLRSTEADLDRMASRLREENDSAKCIYLSPEGCIWQTKPIVCQMFLCDRAQEKVFGDQPTLAERWDRLNEKKKDFTWPDKPVLFDDIEALFINAGGDSPLMYCHKSPGLVHLKQKSRLKTGGSPQGDRI